MFTLGILTSSDMGSKGEREDTSGQAIREMLEPLGFSVARYEVVPDEADVIADRLREWADSGEVDLLVTTGGTGLGPRDVTPEATNAVIQRPAPGIPEAMRQAGLQPHANGNAEQRNRRHTAAGASSSTCPEAPGRSGRTWRP